MRAAELFDVDLDEAEGRVPVNCSGLVFPIHQSCADPLDDRFVRRALYVNIPNMTVLVDFDCAGPHSMPAGDGRFHSIDCTRLSESLVFFSRSVERLYARDAKEAIVHICRWFHTLVRDFHLVHVATQYCELACDSFLTEDLQVVEDCQS